MNISHFYFKLALFLHVAILPVSALEKDLLTSNPNEKNDQSVLDSNQMLAEFDQQLKWFSLYQKTFLKKHQKEFREAGEWEEACKHQQKIKAEIQKSKKEFIEFRDHFVQHLTSIGSPAPYTWILVENARDKITVEYIQLMQDCIFPVRWEAMYEVYQKKRARLD